MVSETTLISMPLKGSAALANHSSSFFWSSFEIVEGWNSAIHFWIVASSAARTGAETANDTATIAAALDMVRKLFLVNGPFLLLNCRMLFLRCSDKLLYRPGSPPDLAVPSRASDRAKNEHGRGQRNPTCEPQARNLKAILADRQRGDRVGADETDPQEVDDG